MNRVPAVVPSLVFFVAFSGASPASADPIRVVSGVIEAGFNALGDPWDAEALYLTGAGLDIGSALEDETAFVQLAHVPTLATGSLVDLSGVLRVSDPIGALLNDEFGLVAAPFTMSFYASPAPLTCRGPDSLLECTGSGQFQFDAVITFTAWGGVPVTHHLIGRGTAQGTLFRRGSYEAGAVRYAFEASPVPEPGTLSLLAASGALAGARAWRRRRAGGRAHRPPTGASHSRREE